MLSGLGIPNKSLRKKLWSKATNTATMLDNVMIQQGKTKNSFQQFFRKGVKTESMICPNKVFGEICVATDGNKVKAKLAD